MEPNLKRSKKTNMSGGMSHRLNESSYFIHSLLLETREAPPAHLLLKIESFSLLDKCGVDKYESKEFDAGGYKWRLIIYPNGHGVVEDGDYVSVYLAVSGTDSLPKNWEVNAVFSIFILNQITGNYHHTPGKTSLFFKLKNEWGFPKFISKADLTTLSNGYLLDDCCLFGAEVTVNNHSAVTDCLSLKDVHVSNKHVIKISDFSKLKDVWYSEEFCAEGYKWNIEVYPNGHGDQTGRSVSIFLEHVPCDKRVKACFTICMKNQLTSISHWFDASNSSWGLDDSFVSLDELKDAKGGFVVKDTCILEIEISVQAVAQ